jgi:hypothetical protein
VPQAVSYSGQGYIELKLDPSWFIASSQADQQASDHQESPS